MEQIIMEFTINPQSSLVFEKEPKHDSRSCSSDVTVEYETRKRTIDVQCEFENLIRRPHKKEKFVFIKDETVQRKTNTTCLIPIANMMFDDQFTDKKSHLVLMNQRNTTKKR